MRGRWLTSDGALTANDYRGVYYTVSTGISLSGSDTDQSNFYIMATAEADNFARGTMWITRVGITSPHGGLVTYDFQNYDGPQRYTGVKRFDDGFSQNRTITGLRLYTTSGQIQAGSFVTVYGLEK